MRQLIPTPSGTDDGQLGDDDLLAAYAYPDDAERWLRAVMVGSVNGGAVAQGVSGPLSSPRDHELFMLLRGLADLVLVGANTVRREGYTTTAVRPAMAKRRQAEGRPPAPAMAIVSGRLDLDLDGPLFRERDSTPILVTGADAPADKVAAAGRRCEVLVAGDGTHVDLSTALRELAARGYRRISCEGGPSLLGQLLAAGLVDELCLTISPLLLGGDAVNLLDGVALHTPLDLNLHQVLAEDGFLFTSYRVGADAAHPA